MARPPSTAWGGGPARPPASPGQTPHDAGTGETLALTLENATLTHVMGKQAPSAAVSVATTRETLDALALKRTTPAQAIQSGAFTVTGDWQILPRLFGMLDDFLNLQGSQNLSDRDKRRAEYLKTITQIRKPLLQGEAPR